MKRTRFSGNNKNKLGELGQLRLLASGLVERAQIAKRLGLSYGTDRDIYTALGYPKTLKLFARKSIVPTRG